MGRHWSDEPRHFTIDLAGATTPERLRDVLAKHFDVAPDIREISCAISLAGQECRYRIAFLHWTVFEQHMPKYARRLKRTLEEYARWHPHALVVDYGTGAPAPVKRHLARRKSVPAPGNQPKSAPEEEPFPAPSGNSEYQPLNYIVLESLAKPTVEQIRAVRELSLLGRDCNMLEMRRVLLCGGHACFGELFEDRAKEISSRLSALNISHRIEKTPVRHIVFWQGEGK